ncbi:MAG: hypothetical protein LBJ59_09160 [Zoogloeaceae bacterium]|nr:hypothetical protein [Zoogloeaceae bacterium]
MPDGGSTHLLYLHRRGYFHRRDEGEFFVTNFCLSGNALDPPRAEEIQWLDEQAVQPP